MGGTFSSGAARSDALRTPVIAFRREACRRIDHGRTGFFVRLREQMTELVGNSLHPALSCREKNPKIFG